VASGPSHHTAEQRGERASLFDHLVGTERQCWRDVLGKWGEVNFLLTTPKCRARWRLNVATSRNSVCREKILPLARIEKLGLTVLIPLQTSRK
jgi:hypothetical protein